MLRDLVITTSTTIIIKKKKKIQSCLFPMGYGLWNIKIMLQCCTKVFWRESPRTTSQSSCASYRIQFSSGTNMVTRNVYHETYTKYCPMFKITWRMIDKQAALHGCKWLHPYPSSEYPYQLTPTCTATLLHTRRDGDVMHMVYISNSTAKDVSWLGAGFSSTY